MELIKVGIIRIGSNTYLLQDEILRKGDLIINIPMKNIRTAKSSSSLKTDEFVVIATIFNKSLLNINAQDTLLAKNTEILNPKWVLSILKGEIPLKSTLYVYRGKNEYQYDGGFLKLLNNKYE